MRIIGIVAAYNEELLIEACLKHHFEQGIEIYLVDNESTDGTVDIARQHLGHGLVGIDSFPRGKVFDWSAMLRHKQELAFTLDADWFIHLDTDEMRLPPEPGQTLAQALEAVDQAGYNAVNFLEFTFIPTREAPDHAHTRFQETMHWYYPYLPMLPHRVNAWKRQPAPVDLVKYGGHNVVFPQQFIYPVSFHMRHYQFLSKAYAEQKYAHRRHVLKELAYDKHRWREQLNPDTIRLPSCAQLHKITEDGRLDITRPRLTHYIDNRTASQRRLNRLKYRFLLLMQRIMVRLRRIYACYWHRIRLQ
jgi:glycosyltransferase involved in cell wall biosynthesis